MNILYICTHNRCRSILSEAITNHLSDGRIKAFSAGSQPVGQVHPLSLKYLAERNISTDGLQSQSWDDFENQPLDLVITVCDSAAGEACPAWFGKAVKVHWGLEDPSKLQGSEAEIRDAFFKTMEIIEARVLQLLTVSTENLSGDALRKRVLELTQES
ncbi:MAG: arsenate reductase ArsC [Oceanobacter sp.]